MHVLGVNKVISISFPLHLMAKWITWIYIFCEQYITFIFSASSFLTVVPCSTERTCQFKSWHCFIINWNTQQEGSRAPGKGEDFAKCLERKNWIVEQFINVNRGCWYWASCRVKKVSKGITGYRYSQEGESCRESYDVYSNSPIYNQLIFINDINKVPQKLYLPYGFSL